jgi:hypothetical protein
MRDLRRKADSPLIDETSLVFDVRSAARRRPTRGSADQSAPDGQRTGGREAVLRYLEREPVASLRPLFGVAESVAHGRAAGKSRKPRLSPGTYLLRLAKPSDAAELLEALQDDPHIRYVEHPAVQFPLVPAEEDLPDSTRLFQLTTELADVATARAWWLTTCRFPEAWDFDIPDLQDAISIIDAGEDGLRNPEIEPRIDIVPSTRGERSRATHAGAVAGVISARRDDPVDISRMEGCCSARLRVFNVWKLDGTYDVEAYCDALTTISQLPPHVVSISLGSTLNNKCIAKGVKLCVDAGHIIVAAMGDTTTGDVTDVFYPANLPGVIAVGACDANGNPTSTTTQGKHLTMLAPGVDILTVLGDNDFGRQQGTSFAAPMVAAAIWLARRKQPMLNAADIRQLLADSAEKAKLKGKTRTKEHGYGRLDVAKLIASVNAAPPGSAAPSLPNSG